MGEILGGMIPEMSPPRCELFLNASGLRVPPGASPFVFGEQLLAQLTSPCEWERTISQMLRWGVRKFYECGPSRTLKFYMRSHELFLEAPPTLLKAEELTTNISV